MKAQPINRVESLGITLSTEDDNKTVEFRTPDEESLFIHIVSVDQNGEDEKSECLGLVDFRSFLALCNRALEIWGSNEEKETKP